MYGQPPPPPMYGQPYGQPYVQPGYGVPPPPPAYGYGAPPPAFGPTVIEIHDHDDDDGTPCPYCGTKTSHITRRKVGCVAIAWGFCLFFTTGFLCCLPCCMDGCQDVQLICVKCQSVKSTIPANCC